MIDIKSNKISGGAAAAELVHRSLLGGCRKRQRDIGEEGPHVSVLGALLLPGPPRRLEWARPGGRAAAAAAT